MLNLKPSNSSAQLALEFLDQNPDISKNLLADCDHDIDRVSTIVEPLLNGPKRCGITAYYIQAVTTGRTAFLTTNLENAQETQVTSIAPSWLIGRSMNCAITVSDPLISRCHTVIGHCPDKGFFITDVGSSNGTFVNRRRLKPLERLILKDGDLIGFSHIQVEFFIVSGHKEGANRLDATQV